jgi:hypothetical protein
MGMGMGMAVEDGEDEEVKEMDDGWIERGLCLETRVQV